MPLSFWRKVLFALRFQSLTILLSNDITAESRIMYYRNIRSGSRGSSPFCRLDGDPYLVVSQEGRLLWFLDGYTTTDRFPYSEPLRNMGNYIRNSVKAVVDAYDGTVQPLPERSQGPAHPDLRQDLSRLSFKPLEDMPEELRRMSAIRAGMLSIQARMYPTYHMQDPQVFYNKEDLWAIPRRRTGRGARNGALLHHHEASRREERRVHSAAALHAREKDNMSAWMAARCDGPNYGKLIVYRFPKQKLVYGPQQIDARIDQDADISQQLTLWNQRGSQVIRGSLLAIPIEKSILYVQPLYLAAEKGQLPELKRVIVAFGNTLAMEENLELSLQQIFRRGVDPGEDRRQGRGDQAPAKEKRSPDRRRSPGPLSQGPGIPAPGELDRIRRRVEKDGRDPEGNLEKRKSNDLHYGRTTA